MAFNFVASTPSDSTPVIPEIKKGQIAQNLPRYFEGLTDWIASNERELLIALLAGAALFLALSFLKKWAMKWSRQANDKSSIRSILARAISKTGRFFRIMLAIELVSVAANTPPFLARIFAFLFTISAVLQAAVWVRELILGLIERRADSYAESNDSLRSAMTLIRLLVSFAIFAIALIVILDNLGVNVTGLVAGLGVGGIAIGLAAQGIFSDLFAAIAIILDKPFRVGDTIRYGTSTATVEKIGMKSTRLRSIGGELLIISNAKLLELEITNFTLTGYRRTRYPIALIYQTPTDKIGEVPALLQKVVESQGGDFVRAGFVGFGASSIDFELDFDIHSDNFQEIFEKRHAVGLAIIAAFAENGFEFAYPSQTTFTASPNGELIMPYAAPRP